MISGTDGPKSALKAAAPVADIPAIVDPWYEPSRDRIFTRSGSPRRR